MPDGVVGGRGGHTGGGDGDGKGSQGKGSVDERDSGDEGSVIDCRLGYRTKASGGGSTECSH